MRLLNLTAALLALCCAGGPSSAQTAADRLNAYLGSPPLLRALLYRMPKGGDLHNHLSGAAYAEATIRAAAAAGNCIDPTTMKAHRPPCEPPARPFADALKDTQLNNHIVDAWSMRDFVPTPGVSGHDQFFAAFAKFGGAASQADMATEVVARAARQRMRYIELMVTFEGSAIGAVADKAQAASPWNPADPAAFDRALRDAGLPDLVAKASKDIDAIEAHLAHAFRCGTPEAQPGCGMTVRWLQQVTRTMPQPRVFAQTLFAGLLQAGDKRVVGLDYVAPEDAPSALADYTAHMRILGYLHQVMPGSNVSLHAGELTLGLVAPEDLTFHIRQAVEIAHAKRIGHGVDVMYEDDPFGLLQQMAKKRIAVEINLTSNEQILGIAGKAHPFPIYRAAGVPTVLSTDDEGIERTDRTNELQLAVTRYGLNWTALAGLERNTLEYAFVEGASLWADARTWRMVPACAGAPVTREPAGTCAAFLQASLKARLQWSLERDLAAFETEARTLRIR